MPADSPFGKPHAPQYPNRPQLESPPQQPQQEEPLGCMCPFLGGVAVPLIDESAIVKRRGNPFEAIQTGITYNMCQKARCHFWDAKDEMCVLKQAALAQIALARQRGVLGK